MRRIDSSLPARSSRAFRLVVLRLYRLCLPISMLVGLVYPAHAVPVTVTTLVTDDQGANAAQITDTGLVNAWGISYPVSGPFWVSANGAGTAQLYSVDPSTQGTTKLGLTVTIPGAGDVTGQVFNTASATGAFNGDAFLFVSEDGTISGWRGALGTTAETLQLASGNNVYKGSALATISGNTYLYAANFKAARIDVLKGSAGAPDLSGNFIDPGIPAGYAPFNIQNIGGKLYVTYALQDATQTDDVAGAGNGFVSVFDTQGNFLGRVASTGALNSPWGLALAPASFGSLAGDLLVGNFGDGRISAFDLGTNAFIDQLTGTNNSPVVIDGLWGLTPGNGGNAGSTQSIYFSAGPHDEAHGLFGVLTPAGVIVPVPEPATVALLCATFAAIGFATRRKRN
jgi:uncharacterized protein (TIGR03118 family)